MRESNGNVGRGGPDGVVRNDLSRLVGEITAAAVAVEQARPRRLGPDPLPDVLDRAAPHHRTSRRRCAVRVGRPAGPAAPADPVVGARCRRQPVDLRGRRGRHVGRPRFAGDRRRRAVPGRRPPPVRDRRRCAGAAGRAAAHGRRRATTTTSTGSRGWSSSSVPRSTAGTGRGRWASSGGDVDAWLARSRTSSS